MKNTSRKVRRKSETQRCQKIDGKKQLDKKAERKQNAEAARQKNEEENRMQKQLGRKTLRKQNAEAAWQKGREKQTESSGKS